MSEMFRKMLRAQRLRIEAEVRALVVSYDFESSLGYSLNADVAASNLAAIPKSYQVGNYSHLTNCMDSAKKTLEGKTAYGYLPLNPDVEGSEEKCRQSIKSLSDFYNKIADKLNEDKTLVFSRGTIPRI